MCKVPLPTDDTLALETFKMNRRQMIAAAPVSLLAAAALAQPQDPFKPTAISNPVKPLELGGWDADNSVYKLPSLPYDKAALEPHIDAQTMEIHHGKHHKGYVDGANKALAELRNVRDGGGDVNLVKHWSRELSFHLSGHINHCLFWALMAPAGKGGGGLPTGDLAKAIDRDFGSFEKFLAHFKAAAQQVEGGGWAWLGVDRLSRRLIVIQQEKQQDMLPTAVTPVLGVDVWEHAYYLKYQNKRADYVSAFVNVINWKNVATLFDATQR